MNQLKNLFLFICLILILNSCTKNQNKSNSSNQLNIYCWSNYIAPKFIEEFEQKTKAKVNLDFFSSNEELLAKLQAGAQGYDLIVPSGYILKALKSLNLIEKLDASNWNEIKNLTDYIKTHVSKETLDYAIPYQVGFSGIAVNRAKIIQNIDSLAWLFEHQELKGQIVMIDDAPVVIGTALKFLGYSYNEFSDEALQKAKALLIKQKKFLKSYTPDAIPILESGEFTIAQAYSGDTLQVKRRNPNIEFIMPKEGGEFSIDYLAIPKGARHIDLAKEFIKMTLDKKLATEQLLYLLFTPVVDLKDINSVKPLLNNKIIFPDEKIIKNFEEPSDSDERLAKIQKIWTELKSL